MREKMRLNGGLTVEAAFVIPIVVVIYVFAIYLCIFLHDRTMIQNNLTVLSENMIKSCFKNIDFDTRAILYEKEWDNILLEAWDDDLEMYQSNIKKSGKRIIEDRLLACSIGDIEVECTYQWLTHTLQSTFKVVGTMNFPIRVFNLSGIRFEVAAQSEITDAVNFLRTRIHIT